MGYSLPAMARFTSPSWDPIKHLLSASLWLICHAALAAVIIGTNWLLWKFVDWLVDGNEPLLCGVLPLRYIFDAMEIGVIAVYAWYGIRGTIRVFLYNQPPVARASG